MQHLQEVVVLSVVMKHFVSNVSSSSSSSSEIVDFLQQRVVPVLKEKLRKFSKEETQQEQQEDRYLLSHIFTWEDNENEFQEVDNSQLTSGQSGHRWM